MRHPVVSHRRGGEEVRAIDGQGLRRRPRHRRGRRQAGERRRRIIHREVQRVRGSPARRRIGHHHRVTSRRRLVAGAQGNRQLRRAHKGRRVPHPVVSHRRAGKEIRPIDGQGLRRRPRRRRSRRQAGDGRHRIIHREVHGVRGASARRRISHHHGISSRRGLVAGAQGDRQLRRAHKGRRVRHRVVGHR